MKVISIVHDLKSIFEGSEASSSIKIDCEKKCEYGRPSKFRKVVLM
jgi:hypothetical protein